MRFTLVAAFIFFTGSFLQAQCLTDFNKLTPEPSIDIFSGFGNAVSVYEDFMAVGIPFSDSLGRGVGLVKLYQLVNNQWINVATLNPKVIYEGMRFGTTLHLSNNYLLIGSQHNKGIVHLFKKQGNNWASPIELTILSNSFATNFGTYHNNNLEISDDENIIAIADVNYSDATMPRDRRGAIFIYQKMNNDEWINQTTPFVLKAFEKDIADFGSSGIIIKGNRLFTGTAFTNTGTGNLFVFKTPNGTFSNLTLEARLGFGDYYTNFRSMFSRSNFTVTNEGVFIGGLQRINENQSTTKIFHFPIQPDNKYIDSSNPQTVIHPIEDNSIRIQGGLLISNQQEALVACMTDFSGNSFIKRISKGVSGWDTPNYESILNHPAPDPSIMNNFGQVFSSHETSKHIVVGYVSDPENIYFVNNLQILTEKSIATWEKHLLSDNRKSTSGHSYGSKLLGFDDYLFVSAPSDGTIRQNGGAVYCYRKNNNKWIKTEKLLPPTGTNRFDDLFGSALASNKKYLAVGAIGFGEKGKVFIYKKVNEHWDNMELVQELTIPEAGLTVFSYGDNLAMSDEWLIVPYVQNDPARIILALFKFNGTKWDFKQIVDVGSGSIFAKFTTKAIAIKDDIIVAGNQIVKLNNNGLWENKYTLMQTDPEPMRISSDFTHWISNGDMFGHSVTISDNTIFIGAPYKDYNGTWDVGAVYVYTKNPDEEWSSKYETAKLLPRIKAEKELFGFSVNSLYNTVIVGAPGDDYTRSYTPRNLPGRTYIFQSDDYLWENIQPLYDFTGDNFKKDYYGINVYMDETDFFIGSSIEDLSTGLLSGATYITPTPPMVKLAPPICETTQTVQLFGYPFGGTWSGPGIIDPVNGIVDVQQAGSGNKIYTYVTPSCTYPGKLRLRIISKPTAKLLVNENMYICKVGNRSTTLAVQAQVNCNYQWYYRINDLSSFSPIAGNNSTIYVNQVGQYKVIVSSPLCETTSSIIHVSEQEIDIQLNEVGPFCETQSEIITLTANPPGGFWSGNRVFGNQLTLQYNMVGTYPLTYFYTSPEGCNYRKETSYTIHEDFEVAINPEGNYFEFCNDQEINLQVTNIPNASYQWLYSSNVNTQPIELTNNNTNEYQPKQSGYYSVKVTRGACEKETELKHIFIHEKDTLFVPNVITPNNDGKNDEMVILSNQQIESLTIYNRYGQTLFISNDNNLNWSGKNVDSGVYYWSLQYYDCFRRKKIANGWVHVIK